MRRREPVEEHHSSEASTPVELPAPAAWPAEACNHQEPLPLSAGHQPVEVLRWEAEPPAVEQQRRHDACDRWALGQPLLQSAQPEAERQASSAAPEEQRRPGPELHHSEERTAEPEPERRRQAPPELGAVCTAGQEVASASFRSARHSAAVALLGFELPHRCWFRRSPTRVDPCGCKTARASGWSYGPTLCRRGCPGTPSTVRVDRWVRASCTSIGPGFGCRETWWSPVAASVLRASCPVLEPTGNRPSQSPSSDSPCS